MIDLLVRKKECLSEILRMIGEFSFADPDTDADSYAAFIEGREEHFQELRRLDGEIQRLPPDDSPSIKELEDEIKSIMRTIINQNSELDKQLPGIVEGYRSRLREVNNTKSINKSYNYDSFSDSGMLFDEKN